MRIDLVTGGVVDRSASEVVDERCTAWDRMHREYFPDDDERRALVIEAARGTGDAEHPPRVLDLGCGPGSLVREIATAVPGAEVIGIDADPRLITLARARDHVAGTSFHTVTLGGNSGSAFLRSLAPFDAIVSTAFVHYFDTPGLVRLLRDLRPFLTRGGSLVTAEWFHDDHAPSPPERRTGESPWARWWRETEHAPSLWGLIASDPPLIGDGVDSAAEPAPLSLAVYLDALDAAGFTLADLTDLGGSHVVRATPTTSPERV